MKFLVLIVVAALGYSLYITFDNRDVEVSFTSTDNSVNTSQVELPTKHVKETPDNSANNDNQIEDKSDVQVDLAREIKGEAVSENKEKQKDIFELLFVELEPFDLKSYQQDPLYRKNYLEAVVPARANRKHGMKPNAPIVYQVSSDYVALARGEQAELKVKVLPHVPVSFTSVDGGQFVNGEQAITIESDSQGMASVIFTTDANQGVQGTILCGSAVCAGRIEFAIDSTRQIKN